MSVALITSCTVCLPSLPYQPLAAVKMSSAQYQKLPQDDSSDSGSTSRLRQPHSPTSTEADEDSHRPLRASVQAEFNRPPPSWVSRAALIVFIIFLGWASFKLGGGAWGGRKPEVIYASR